ncbi:hypothetical protein MMC34_001729 [Xylographa carneopallida]|nr:hypothetical protein [Xylographa carneopallida]
MFSALTHPRARPSDTTPPSPPPTTIHPFFATSLKSALSPPATTTTTTSTTSPPDYFSLSPSSASTSGFLSPSSPGTLTTAYPSWPHRASLALSIHSPTRASHAYPSSTYTSDYYTLPTSYISTQDLLDLGAWGLHEDDEVDAAASHAGADIEGLGISWSATRQPEVVVGEERRRRNGRGGAPPPLVRGKGARERSRSVRRRGRLGFVAE